MIRRLCLIPGLFWISYQVFAENADFDTSTRVVSFPVVSVNKQDFYSKVQLLLNEDGTWHLLDYSAVKSSAKSLPLLNKGQHISFIKSFNAVQSEITDMSMQQHWNEALAHGMKTGRIQLDWVDLEPSPGKFDKQLLESALIAMRDEGLQPFVLIAAIDNEGFTGPRDLLESATPDKLVQNIQFDHAAILQRFNVLLDWVVPMVAEYGGWTLSVGNEPGNYLQEWPETEKSLVNFLINARNHAHSLNSGLAITMTLAQLYIESGNNFHEEFLKNSDVACFNYYAANLDFYFDDLTKVDSEIDQMLSVSGDKQLILQELGAAAGYEDKASAMMASKEKQKIFFDRVFMKMEREPRFRVAYVFQLIDWDAELVDQLYTQTFKNAGLPIDFIVRFAESLETTGLIRYTDGRARPAWDVVLHWIKKFNH